MFSAIKSFEKPAHNVVFLNVSSLLVYGPCSGCRCCTQTVLTLFLYIGHQSKSEMYFSRHSFLKHTLFCQKYSLTHPNDWNQVFQSRPWPQVYKSTWACRRFLQTVERMGHPQWIPPWYSDRMPPVQQVQLGNFLTPKYSTVNYQCCYDKVEANGMPRGMPHKMTKWGQRMLRCIMCRGRQLSAEPIALGFHGRAAASKPYINKCNAKRGDLFSGVTTRASPSGNLMDESGFGGCQQYLSDCTVSSVKFGGGGLWCGAVLQGLGLDP